MYRTTVSSDKWKCDVFRSLSNFHIFPLIHISGLPRVCMCVCVRVQCWISTENLLSLVGLSKWKWKLFPVELLLGPWTNVAVELWKTIRPCWCDVMMIYNITTWTISTPPLRICDCVRCSLCTVHTVNMYMYICETMIMKPESHLIVI